jgi:hypothetical protein
MKMRSTVSIAFALLSVVIFEGCVTNAEIKSYDYTNYRAHPPRSILILPPLNESTDIKGTYGYLSTVTAPVAEMGYYVFPVAVVDQFFKENGMPTAGEMHQASLDKIREIVGADAVLYITLKEYGTHYRVLDSLTEVVAEAALVDTRTGTVLWEGTLAERERSGENDSIVADLISAVITQAINKSTDHAHSLSHAANMGFSEEGHGLLYGPYHPKHEGQ